MLPISKERAERIARAHACVRCGEYTYKQLRVKPATETEAEALKARWVATMTCGVCATQQEVGIDEDGDIVYVG